MSLEIGRRFSLIAPLFGVALLFAACSDQTGLGSDNDPLGLSGADVEPLQAISAAQLATTLPGEAARVEIKLFGDDLVAREVRIGFGDDIGEPEEIRSRITGLEVEGGQGALQLALGGLSVRFTEATEFRAADAGELTLAEFLDRVEQGLAAGRPGIEARRGPPAQPQGPDNPEFVAAELILDDGLEEPAISINIDRDNLRLNDVPPPDGWIDVLGLAVALRVSDGITSIEVERPDLAFARFEGVVVSVDLVAQSFTLRDGTVIRIVDRTWIEHGWFWSRRLRTLGAVKEAIDAGHTVLARGRGVIRSTEPLTIIAIRVEFHLDPESLQRFSGRVEGVNLDRQLLRLVDGTVIRTNDRTIILLDRGDEVVLVSLEAAARALNEGLRVFAKGIGVEVRSQTDSEAGALIAIVLIFEFERAPPETVPFEGVVASVNLENVSFTLEDGTVVLLRDLSAAADTRPEEERWSLRNLQQALEAGLTIVAFGAGIPVELDDGTAALVAVELRFDVRLANPTEFEGIVQSVDLEARSFTLTDGTVVKVIGLTVVQPMLAYRFEVLTLEAIARAVESGLVVRAVGGGELVNEDPRTIVALKVEFQVDFTAIVEFEGRVVSVDPEAGSLTLEDGTVVLLTLGTEIGAEIDLNTVERVGVAIDGGAVVIARGAGIVVATDPLTVLALRIAFSVSSG